MPDANGQFKGKGWSRASEAAYERIFSNAATQQPTPADILTTPDVKRRYDELLVRNGLPPLSAPSSVECCTKHDAQAPPCWHGCPKYVPTPPAPEVEHLADRTAAEADGWEPDYEEIARREDEAAEDRFGWYF